MSAHPKTTVELKLPSRLGFEKVAMATAANVAKLMGFGDARIEDLKTAVSEACINAIEHGNRLQEQLSVVVLLTLEASQLEVKVIDKGHGVTKKVAKPDMEKKLHGEESPRGLGLFLIENLVDEVEFVLSRLHHRQKLRPGGRDRHDLDASLLAERLIDGLPLDVVEHPTGGAHDELLGCSRLPRPDHERCDGGSGQSGCEHTPAAIKGLAIYHGFLLGPGECVTRICAVGVETPALCCTAQPERATYPTPTAPTRTHSFPRHRPDKTGRPQRLR